MGDPQPDATASCSLNFVVTDDSTSGVDASAVAVYSEQLDEIASALLSDLKCSSSKKLLEELSNEYASQLPALAELLNSLPLYKVFDDANLDLLYGVIQSRPVRPLMSITRSTNQKNAIAALESFLQHSFGFQLIAPPHWIETVRHNSQTSVTNLSTEEGPSSSQAKTAVSSDVQPLPTRTWLFSPEKEKPRPGYAFEMTIVPGMPLSYINFKFTFNQGMNGFPDAQFSIFRAKKLRNTRQDLTDLSEDVSHLIPFCENPSLLESECDRLLGRLPLKNFADPSSSTVTVQITTTTLYEALAAAQPVDDYFKYPVTLYILIEVAHSSSLIQQINSRTSQLANSSKNRNRNDRSTKGSGRSSNAKKKLHIFGNKKKPVNVASLKQSLLPISNTRACQNKRNAARRVDASTSTCDARPSNCLVEFSLTLYRSNSNPLCHVERIVIQRDADVHSRLLDIALCKNVHELGYRSKERLQCAQTRALDLLTWVSQNWRIYCADLSCVVTWLNRIIADYDQFFAAGFALASNGIAHRWCILTSQLLRMIFQLDINDSQALFTRLITCMKGSIEKDLAKIEKGGALHWFLATVFATIYESSYLVGDGDHVGAANELADVCSAALRNFGRTFQKQWTQSMHYTLSTKHNLNGFVLDLNMFDWPTQMMGFRVPMENGCDHSETGRHVMQAKNLGLPPMPIPGMSGGNPPSNTAQSPFVMIQNNPAPSAFQGLQKLRENVNRGLDITDGEQLASGKLFNYSEFDSIGLMEILNLNCSESVQTTRDPLLLSVSTDPEWFDFEDKAVDMQHDNDLLSKYSWSRMPFGSDLMPGLMEGEPLAFTCIGSSDYIRVFNPNDQSVTPLVAMDPIEGARLTKKATEVEQMLAAAGHQLKLVGHTSFQLSNEIYSLFKPPPDLVLSFDSNSTNTRHSVILDFGGPTLLRSFIIPPCEYANAVIIDSWWSSESSDSIRLAYSTTIGSKALILSNMTPAVLIQKLKLTFVTDANNGRMRVPLGRYFGSKWLTKSDVTLCALPHCAVTADPVNVDGAVIECDGAIKLTSILEYFCEEIRGRYNIAAADLQKAVEESHTTARIQTAYNACFLLRLQWNTAYGVMEKLRCLLPQDKRVRCLYEDLDDQAVEDLDMDHLKTLCVSMMSFSNELLNLLDLRESTREVAAQLGPLANSNFGNEEPAQSVTTHILPTPILTLEGAVELFGSYCSSSIPQLQAYACAHIFKGGCFASWWGDFFPAILRRFFSTTDSSKIDNEVFLVLAVLCTQSVKHSYLQQIVMEKLFHFMIDVTNELLSQETDEYNNCKSPLLCWTLQLLSTTFDVVSSNKRKTDRWAFLSGIFGQQTNAPCVPFSQSSSASQVMISAAPLYEAHSQADKIFVRWKEAFNNEDFTTELDKPQFIARRLDILGDRLRYLYALIREEYEGIPATPPPKREPLTTQNPAVASVEAAPPKSTAPSIPDPAAGRLLIVPLHNLQSRIRVRQYSARLKIADSLCLSVVQTLLNLLLSERSKQLVPFPSQLLAIKVMSKICVHGPMTPISLVTALGDNLYELVFKLLSESTECEWMRHALLMLLIDLTDAEMRTLGRSMAQKDLMLTRDLKAMLEDPEEVEIEAKRHKIDLRNLEDVDMSEDNSMVNDIIDQEMDDVATPESVPLIADERDSDGPSQTALDSGVDNKPWTTAAIDPDFVTFANFDNILPDEADDQIVRATVASIIGAKVLNPAFLSNTKGVAELSRFSALLQWMYRWTRFCVDRGESLSHIFRFFDEAIAAEADFLNKLTDARLYTESYPNAIYATSNRTSPLNPVDMPASSSATYFIEFCIEFYTEERRGMALKQRNNKNEVVNLQCLAFRFQQAVFEVKYHVRIGGARQLCRMTHISELELSRAMNGHLMRFHHKLPELTSLALDAAGDKMISADPNSLKSFDRLVVDMMRCGALDLHRILLDDVTSLERVLLTFSKMMFIHSTWPQMEDMIKNYKAQPFSEISLIEAASAVDTPPDPASVGQNGMESMQPLDTAELKSALEHLTAEDQALRRLRIYNNAVHVQFYAELNIAADSTSSPFIQPHDFIIECTADRHYGFLARFETKFRERIRAALSRNCVYNFVPHCPPQRRSTCEEKEYSVGMGHSVRSVILVVNQFLTNLTTTVDPMTVIDVLNLYLEFTGYIQSANNAYNSTKSSTASFEKALFGPPALTATALMALLDYVVSFESVDEQLWLNALNCITANLREENSTADTLAAKFNLQKFLQRFFADALHPYGLASNYGASVMEKFGLFLNKMLAADKERGIFLEQFVDTINDVLANANSSTLGVLAVEPLLCAIEVVGCALTSYKPRVGFDIQKVSLLLHRTIEMIQIAFQHFDCLLKVSTHQLKGLISGPLSYTSFCFTNMAPAIGDATSDRSVAATTAEQSVILPKLSFVTTKTQPVPEVAFRKSKSWKHPSANFNASAMDSLEYEAFDYPANHAFEFRSCTDQFFERCGKDRIEMLFISLLKFVDACSKLGPVRKVFVQLYHSSVTTLVELVNEYDLAAESLADINLELWRPSTLADYVLYTLLALSVDIGADGELAQRFMQIILQSVFVDTKHVIQLSAPMIFALTKINHDKKRKDIFVQLDGHINVAEQLRRCLLLESTQWSGKYAMFNLSSQLTSLANEVNGIVPQAFDVKHLPSKMINNVKCFNFAPTSRINGSGPMNQATLGNLLLDPVPHRRSRQPVFNYNYPPNELWMSITITLPCQIMLHELQIRCHQYSSLSKLGANGLAGKNALGLDSPAAMQIELSADGSPSRNWTLFGGELSTSGLVQVVVDMTPHRGPVGALRLHFRRPHGHCPSLNLSQIFIYGTIKNPLQSDHEQSLIHWLTIYEKFQAVQPSLWFYAPKLPQMLIQLFIRMRMDHKVYNLLRQVICNIDHRSNASDSTVIELILNHVIAGGRLCDGVPPVVSAELLYSFCTPSADMIAQRAIVRLSQLLRGVEQLLPLVDDAVVFDGNTFSVILWAAACAIWTNLTNAETKKETVFECNQIGERIRVALWKLSTSTTITCNTLKDAAAWLLCSICRSTSAAAQKFALEFTRANQNGACLSSNEYFAISKIFQSEDSALELINCGFLRSCVETIVAITDRLIAGEVIKESTLLHLTSLVYVVSELANVNVVCFFLEQQLGLALFKNLLSALIFSLSVKTTKKAAAGFAKLDQAAVKLAQRCISYSGLHRKRIADLLTELLKDRRSQFSGRLDGSLLQLLLRLVLEDELYTVKLCGIQPTSLTIPAFKDRLMHPLFGCNSTDRVFDVSAYVTVRELIPVKQSFKSKANVSNCYDDLSSLDWMPMRKAKELELPEATDLPDGVPFDEFGLRGYLSRVFCEQISNFNSLDLTLQLRQLMCNDPTTKNTRFEISTDGTINRKFTDDIQTTGGYLALLMSIRVTLKAENQRDPEYNPVVPANELTMLQYFAMAGGFCELSRYFPMADHYGAVLETFEHLNKKHQDIRTKSEATPKPDSPSTSSQSSKPEGVLAVPKFGPMPGTSTSVVQLHADISNVALATQQLQQQVQSMLGQVSSASSLQAMIAGTPVSLSVIEPSSIVTYPNGDQPSSAVAAFIPKTYASSQLMDSQAFEVLNYALQISGGPPFVLSPGSSIISNVSKLPVAPRRTAGVEREVPAYTIFALSMFLKLDYYAITLVTSDRSLGKRVLRVAMGLPAADRDFSEFMASYRPVMPKNLVSPAASPTPASVPERKFGYAFPGQGSANISAKRDNEKAKVDMDNLTIYPFYVLERVWTLSGPFQCGKEVSGEIRVAADTQGILDVILLCASRFSNTLPRHVASFPPTSDVRAIDQIFQLSDQIDALREAIASVNSNPGKPPAPQPNASPPFGYLSNSMTMMIDNGNEPMPQGNQQDFWAKGTGFGSGTTAVQWNLNEHVRRRRLNEDAVTCMLNTVSGFLMPYHDGVEKVVNEDLGEIGLVLAQRKYDKAANFHKESLEPKDQFYFPFSVILKVYNSCIMPVIHSYLTNDSVFDISKHVAVYEACIWFIVTVASLTPVMLTEDEVKLMPEPVQNRDILSVMLTEEHGGNTILGQMKRMHQMIKAYLSTIDKERHCATTAACSTAEENEAKVDDAKEEENLEVLAAILEKGVRALQNRVSGHHDGVVEEMEVDDAAVKDYHSLDELYSNQMKKLQYESVSFLKPDGKTMEIPHHYSNTFLQTTQSSNPRRMRRLAQEAITLSSSLPLSASSSVFLRASEERLDVFKVLITGPADTPYSNGCFEFDAYFPPDYPQSPVQISLQTTGNNSVRFNPNLYNDGKVCLSILNTWHGRPEERWNAETSSFLQVIVSIQSLILVNEPYFNEPGYERSRNTPAGQQASRDYDANIRTMTVRWAMLEQLRHPSRAFEGVIKRHFWLKRDEICDQIKGWIEEMQKIVNDSPEQSERTIKASLGGMTRNFESLKEEFAKMTPPPGLEHVESRYFPVVAAPDVEQIMDTSQTASNKE